MVFLLLQPTCHSENDLSFDQPSAPTLTRGAGTSSIVHEQTHQPLLSTLALIVETAVSLRQNGYWVVLVSSGAIGIALQKMHLDRRPKHLPQVQALAAIGQCRLMGLWEEMFERLGQTVAQILLTRNDIADRTQYLNAQNTFAELLNMGVIPIVNENDTLGVTEIKFGDNDTLSAITAGMVGADYLFLMTDVDCLYDKNPRAHPDARPIEVVENILDLAVDVSSAGSALGTGGMSTKIVAARLATAAGVTTVITRSSLPGNVAAIVHYIEAKKAALRASADEDTPKNGMPKASDDHEIPSPPLHTRFLPSTHRIRDRHFWILHGLTPHGTIYIDHGAAAALSEKAGLLPVGVVDVSGAFAQQECVRIVEVDRPRGFSSASTLTGSNNPSRPHTPPNGPHHKAQQPSITALANLSRTSTPSPAPSPPTTATPHYANQRELGRALVNYSAIEIKRIAGHRSTEIASILGYADTEYVAFRESIALLSAGTTDASSEKRRSVLLAAAEAAASGSAAPAAVETSEGQPARPQTRSRLSDTTSGNLAGSMGIIDFENRGREGDSREGSGQGTPLPATPSEGRIGLGLGGYVEGRLSEEF